MSGASFKQIRLQLGLSIREIADRFGTTYSATKQWQRSGGPPAQVEVWLLALVREREELPAAPWELRTRAPPAASGYLEAQPL